MEFFAKILTFDTMPEEQDLDNVKDMEKGDSSNGGQYCVVA
ncbi:hypothetical protein PIIN_09273 [Serendipita indica DSM 11827]|uniref:Uncharacterized protein n=1 Tax=Serendipita indica (strain DSM 11827) TaxID=1109443 RepID=G4TVE6_SERID|nr:hypothetical protein PIIN_09273 [Serendipita indica DSM 11827]